MSAVPAAVDALVAALEKAIGRNKVIDGPPVKDIPGDVVAVGVAPTEPADVESSEEPSGLRSFDEVFDVICLARSWSGNEAVKPQRDRTYALVNAAKAAVRADPTLAGAVYQAQFVGSSYMPWRSDAGQLVVDVPFRIRIRAYGR